VIIWIAAALLSPPGLIDDSDARSIHSWDPTPECQDWTRARRRNESDAFEAWVTGLITGYNLYNADRHQDILRGTSLADAFAWIDRRCDAQPERAMVEVAMELVDELSTRAAAPSASFQGTGPSGVGQSQPRPPPLSLDTPGVGVPARHAPPVSSMMAQSVTLRTCSSDRLPELESGSDSVMPPCGVAHTSANAEAGGTR
jgi:hypothetical protein